MTKTLYDLLGALPDDGAEGLRTAFRTAVKGSHPDINPGDPDAALKFRQIVHANGILSDQEQRAAYDHLLDLARLEQASASKHTVAAAIYKLASGTTAVASALIVTIAGYLLLAHNSVASVVPPDLIEFTRGLSQIAAFSSVETRDTNGPKAPPDKHGSASSPDSSVLGSSVPDPTAPQESSAPDAVTQPAPLFASAATPYRPRDISAAIAELDQAMQLDPKFSAAYIDRNIIFFRRQKLAHAFASIHPTRHIERMSRAEPAPIRAKAHFIGFRAMSVSPRRMAQQDAPRGYLNTYSAEQDWNASRKARGNVREGP